MGCCFFSHATYKMVVVYFLKFYSTIFRHIDLMEISMNYVGLTTFAINNCPTNFGHLQATSLRCIYLYFVNTLQTVSIYRCSDWLIVKQRVVTTLHIAFVYFLTSSRPCGEIYEPSRSNYYIVRPTRLHCVPLPDARSGHTGWRNSVIAVMQKM